MNGRISPEILPGAISPLGVEYPVIFADDGRDDFNGFHGVGI